MSDSKKPTVSEIRARYEPMYAGDIDVAYLLDLVERMGKMIDRLVFRHHCEHYGPIEDCDLPKCRAARALLEEIKL